MLTYSDRLYGRLDLPDLVRELASECPVMLRLREIRMPNIPFVTYPAFAHVDRYQHSLGVAHLAWRWARRNSLAKKDALALTIAALYHDGATPAFGHLFEEFLTTIGFDHETALSELLLGKPKAIPGHAEAQIFLGQGCHLRAVLAQTKTWNTPISTTDVASIAAGQHYLGAILKGDIDLDNIDNVIRASTAMGIVDTNSAVHPYEVADALVLENDRIMIDATRSSAIEAWQALRFQLYDEILSNSLEFRAQTALKWAIDEWMAANPDELTERAWLITEPMLVFHHLRANAFSRLLVDRVRLARPPRLLFCAAIGDLTPLVARDSREILRGLSAELSDLCNEDVYVNFYLDKRVRQPRLPQSKRSLFRNYTLPPNSPKECSSPPHGLVGAVALSLVERRQCTGLNMQQGRSIARRTASDEAMKSVLRKWMDQDVDRFSTAWIKSDSNVRSRQIRSLFDQ